MMSSPAWKIVVPIAVLLLVALLFYWGRTGPLPNSPVPTPSADCPRPASAAAASDTNIEFALTESIKVLKVGAAPKLLDSLPKEARSLEMVEFLTCRASAQKLITTNAEMLEYTKLLGVMMTGKPRPSSVRHDGMLGNLEKHLQTTPDDNFMLALTDRKLLPQFMVEELHSKDWPAWFQEFCTRYSGCLACSPKAGSITTRVSVSPVPGKLTRVQDNGPVTCTSQK